ARNAAGLCMRRMYPVIGSRTARASDAPVTHVSELSFSLVMAPSYDSAGSRNDRSAASPGCIGAMPAGDGTPVVKTSDQVHDLRAQMPRMRLWAVWRKTCQLE